MIRFDLGPSTSIQTIESNFYLSSSEHNKGCKFYTCYTNLWVNKVLNKVWHKCTRHILLQMWRTQKTIVNLIWCLQILYMLLIPYKMHFTWLVDNTYNVIFRKMTLSEYFWHTCQILWYRNISFFDIANFWMPKPTKLRKNMFQKNKVLSML